MNVVDDGRPLSRIEEAASHASFGGARVESLHEVNDAIDAVRGIGIPEAAAMDKVAVARQVQAEAAMEKAANQMNQETFVGVGAGIGAREAYGGMTAAPGSTVDELLRARADAFRRP
ncbi:MAG TPA: hypothetical protein VLC46_06010 [Thermoanaerobaculia bacterium]|jgi:hypothetical protein|nr:hypothetical protein [Thermoanaerobaculia bacterium]